MQRVNDFWFYRLGAVVHPLTETPQGRTVKSLVAMLFRARFWMELFLDGDKAFPFKVSLRPARSLREALETITEDKNYERILADSEVTKLTTLGKEFETIVAAEVATFNTYSVTQKMGYDTPTLIDEGECLLPESVRSKIPSEAVEDLRQATKCMAFEVSTASGFHTVRAAESVIRLYYKQIVGNMPATKDRNWGAYIRVLKARGADPRVTGFLDHIRENYRNPITHPAERLGPEEAQVLLGICISAIIQMVQAIDTLRASSLSLPIPPAPVYPATRAD